jgi:hypothetical protein
MCLTNRQTIVSWPLDLRLDSELLPLLAQPERPKRDAIVPTGALDVAGVDGALLDSLGTAGRSADVRRFVIALAPDARARGARSPPPC